MKRKFLYFDVETTGIDPVKNDIIQVSGMVEIDGKVLTQFDMKVKPFDLREINPKALEVNKTTVEDLKTYPEPGQVYDELVAIFSKYVDMFDKRDKFTPVAYNGKFDLDFLNNFFLKNGSKYFGAWQNWELIDPMAIARFYFIYNNIPIENFKLVTVCKYFGIEFDAHDALEDIKATKSLLEKLKDLMITGQMDLFDKQ